MAIETPRGPRVIVPYLEYKGLLVRRPVLGGVFVVSPDGAIEDLEPEEAARRPELASSGRILPDTQARRIQDAYQYKGGIWNAWFVHEDQTQITDTDSNPQPYLVDFGGDLGTQWVTVAEPYGRAFAASVVFMTDTETGRTRIWRVPRETSLSGNRRAIEAVRAVSIPGIDFGDGTIGSGNFRVVEPRPVFVDDRARLPHLDHPEHGQRGLQDRRRGRGDEQARGHLRQRPRPAVGGEDPALHRDGRGARTTPRSRARRRRPRRRRRGRTAARARPRRPGPGTRRTSGARLEDVIRRQRELLEEVEALREALRAQDGG